MIDGPYQLRDLINSLTPRGVELPPEVIQAINLSQRISASAPPALPHNALRDAILVEATDEVIAATLLQEVAGTRLSTAYGQAANRAASLALDLVMDHRDQIHTQLAVLAEACISSLRSVADLGPTTLDILVRDGSPGEAKLFADRETTAAELNALYMIRDSYLIPGGARTLKVDVYDCSKWANPLDIANHITGTTQAEQFISGLTAGGTLYYPRAEEATAAAQKLWDDYAAVETERLTAEFGVGSTVYFQ